MRAVPLLHYDEPDFAEPVRVCPCGREASDALAVVRCPRHGVIPRWGVALRGELLYAAPEEPRSQRRGRDLATRTLASAAPVTRPEALRDDDEVHRVGTRAPASLPRAPRWRWTRAH